MIAWLQKQSTGLRLFIVLAYCAGIYGLLYILDGFEIQAVSIVTLTVFPMLYGAAMQLILDPHSVKTFRWVLVTGLLPILVLCAGLLIVELETLICIVILLPIFILLAGVGQGIMRGLLRNALVDASSDRLNVSILLLPILAVPLFGEINFPEVQMQVTTQIEIAAPADVIWDNTFEITQIADNERVWTFSHNILGTPLPIDAIVDGTVRKLRWSGGVRFEEHLTEFTPNQNMSWNFVFNAPETLAVFDPHIAPQGGLVNMESGSYWLSALPNDETLLTLETNYSIRSPINAYLALWGEVFLQDFHHAVLSVIKMRSEKVLLQ